MTLKQNGNGELKLTVQTTLALLGAVVATLFSIFATFSVLNREVGEVKTSLEGHIEWGQDENAKREAEAKDFDDRLHELEKE